MIINQLINTHFVTISPSFNHPSTTYLLNISIQRICYSHPPPTPTLLILLPSPLSSSACCNNDNNNNNINNNINNDNNDNNNNNDNNDNNNNNNDNNDDDRSLEASPVKDKKNTEEKVKDSGLEDWQLYSVQTALDAKGGVRVTLPVLGSHLGKFGQGTATNKQTT